MDTWYVQSEFDIFFPTWLTKYLRFAIYWKRFWFYLVWKVSRVDDSHEIFSRVSISQFVSTKSCYMYQRFIWNSVSVALGLLMLICDIDIKNVKQERTLRLRLKSKTFTDWLFILFVFNNTQRRIRSNPLITNHAHSLYQCILFRFFTQKTWHTLPLFYLIMISQPYL